MSLDPQIEAILQLARANKKPSFHQCTLEEARNILSSSATGLGPGPEVHQVSDVLVNARWGNMPGRLYRSADTETGLIVYVHGGGWCLGDIPDFDMLCRLLCQQSQCAVLLPGYRLAPEHPFPHGLEDVIDTLQWAWQERSLLCGGDVPIVAAGDSAGANLVAVAVNELRSTIPIAMQVLVYPVAACHFNTESYQQFSEGYPLMREDMQWFFQHYAPSSLWADQRVSPIHNQNLSGLPKTWMGIADHDVLRDDGLSYAEALRNAGNDVVLRVYPGMTHGFIRMANLVDVARDAVCEMALAVRDCCQKIHIKNDYQNNQGGSDGRNSVK